MDPTAIITSISIGLKLLDLFRDLAGRLGQGELAAPSTSVEQTKNSLQIKRGNQVIQEIKSSEIQMSEWDDVRYRALERRVKVNWELYHELYSQLPELAMDERARIKIRLETTKGELCEDFRQMVKLYERALGVPLPDHYSLHDICG